MNKQPNSFSGYVCPKCFRQVDACTCERGSQHLIQIDEGVQDAVRILNEKGYPTRYCCESHYQSVNTQVYVSFGQEWGFQTLPEGFAYNRTHRMVLHRYNPRLTQEQFDAEKQRSLKALLDWCTSLDPAPQRNRTDSSQEINPRRDPVVWYACYGTNVSESRFMKYINDCRDKTPPTASKPFYFPHPIYFAGKSRTWENKGSAFLDDGASGRAYGRIYLITAEQYEDVKRMEGRRYSKKLSLGSVEGIPVVSFTSPVPRSKQQENAPSLEEFDTILQGYLETFPELEKCVLATTLMDSLLTDSEEKVLFKIRNAPHGVSSPVLAGALGISEREVTACLTRLMKKNWIRQDRRTLDRPATSPEALFYTMPDMRQLIDKMQSLRQQCMAQMQEADLHALTLESESAEPEVGHMEGRQVSYTTTRYERSPENRRAAIRIHGAVCCVCGFDFYDTYGEAGKDFIEVHHVKPLNSVEEETIVNPETDLVCLCSNCHRMIHRRRNGVYSVDDLRAMVRRQRFTSPLRHQ